MSVVRTHCGPLLAVCLLVVAFCGPLRAVDKNATEKSDDAKAAAKDRYKLPDDGSVKDLLAFIKEIRSFRPNAQEARQHSVKAMAVIKAAAERIQEIATPEDKKLDGYREAMDYLLAIRVQKAAAGVSNDEGAKLLGEILSAIEESKKPSQALLSAAMQYASALEYAEPPEPTRAADAYGALGAALAKNADPLAAKIGAKMEGAARRMNLLGHTMELTGTNVDGDKFDWAKYRGKVVLVDFWATWCPPCRAELPNVKKNYELYHDRGFDVVGISLDHERAPLTKFLADQEIPWTTLYDNEQGETPSANYYGVMGIPTVILVDKEGKVVSTMARGPELGAQLEKLLGPAEPEKKDAEEKK